MERGRTKPRFASGTYEFLINWKLWLTDKLVLKRMNDVYAKFRDYMDVEPDSKRPSVAYFSMEYGLNHVLKIYSGGLGVLAGDYLKEASDSNGPLRHRFLIQIWLFLLNHWLSTDNRFANYKLRTLVHFR